MKKYNNNIYICLTVNNNITISMLIVNNNMKDR